MAGASPSSLDDSSPRCDSMPLFIHLLRKHADERGLTNTTIYIVSSFLIVIYAALQPPFSSSVPIVLVVRFWIKLRG